MMIFVLSIGVLHVWLQELQRRDEEPVTDLLKKYSPPSSATNQIVLLVHQVKRFALL